MTFFSDHEIHAVLSGLSDKNDFVFLDSCRITPENRLSYLFTRPVASLVCEHGDDADSFLEEAESFLAKGYYLAGWISYEFGYLLESKLRGLLSKKGKDSGPLASLGVYQQPEKLVYNLKKSRHEAEPVKKMSDLHHITNLRTNIDREAYIKAINQIKKYIIAGDTYQVNFTLKLNFEILGSLQSLYRALRFNQSVSYGAWIRDAGRDIMSFSPELFFASDREKIRVRPMKGTMRRGLFNSEDERLRDRLHQDSKNRAENVMIVDLLRNDLGRLLHETGRGAVQVDSLFDVETYETLLQMTSTITATPRKRSSIGFADIMKALFPCGSVTGAPKIRTMEIIGELETEPRGVYTGAIGFVHRDDAVFNVPIRTLVLKGGRGEMGIGSGIVFDSDAGDEWRECLLKGDFLTKPRPDFQLIETLLWQPQSGFLLLDYHLERLADSATYFLFSCDIDVVREKLDAKADGFTRENKAVRVRILLSSDGKTELTTAACSQLSPQDLLVPIRHDPLPLAVFSAHKVDSSSPYVFHKTTLRPLYEKERKRAVDRGYYEVFFENESREVTEGSISNIVIQKNDTYVTPPIECGLLGGVFRRFLLEVLGRRIEEKVLTLEDVLAADEVYMINSVRGMVAVQVVQGGLDRSVSPKKENQVNFSALHLPPTL